MAQQKRATFNDVGNAQDKLDRLIKDIITNNKPLDASEQKQLKKTFRLATLGLCSEHQFFLKTSKGVHDLGHAGHAFRWLIKQTKNPVVFHNPEEHIALKEIWQQLWDVFNKVYDPALNVSIKISKEQTHFGPSEPAEV